MSKNVLFTANTLRHLYLCHMPYFEYFKNNNYKVYTVSDDDRKLKNVFKSFKINIKRKPFNLSNIRALIQLKKIIANGNYDIIHTHTPMGAALTRIAAKMAKYKKTIIYTVHGFHFFKNCPFINWFLYYPVEKILSRYTDLIITINSEDYEFAKKHFQTKIAYVPGVGFNENKFKISLTKKEKEEFRQYNGLSKDDFIISYIAEISTRKRQSYLIKTISKMNITNEKFLLIGDANKRNLNKIKRLIRKYKLEDVVKIIGFNDKIAEYLEISDLVISVSAQEGLPLNIMEAMYKKKPIIVTDCRGNTDLIQNMKNGIVVEMNNQQQLRDAICLLKNDQEIQKKFAKNNKKIIGKYSIKNVMKEMDKIYKEIMENNND